MPPSSAIILAGGQSRRMGRDKTGLMVADETLLSRTIRVLGGIVDEIVVVGRSALPDGSRAVQTVEDDFPGAGPLGGVVTGLRRVGSPYALAVACDLPFLQPGVLAHLLELAPGFDAVVPRVGGRVEGTHAVYARDVRETLAGEVAAGRLALVRALARLRVRWVEEDELRPLDRELLSFVNVNTPNDWQAALALNERRCDESFMSQTRFPIATREIDVVGGAVLDPPAGAARDGLPDPGG